MPEPITLTALGIGLGGLTAHLARRYFDMAKEVFDVVVGFVALVISLPVLALCAVIIKVSSKGPVFYRQKRAGKDGRTFMMYKLRTMRLGAETATGAVWACDNDPRIIGACRWMRRSHLDELPQLINVIKGEMSLVGPRPERPEILAELEKVYPQVRKRLKVRPGITGLAQIRNGYDTDINAFRHKLEADLEYLEYIDSAKNHRWGRELRIMAATLKKFKDKQAK